MHLTDSIYCLILCSEMIPAMKQVFFLFFACAITGGYPSIVAQTVSKTGTADFRTIQAAVDGAASNAVIRVAAGVYQENLFISKPVTLLGAGWQQTRIEVPGFTGKSLEETFEKLLKELESIDDPKQFQAAMMSWRKPEKQYPVVITNAGAVRIEGIHFQWAGPKSTKSPVIQALVYGRQTAIEMRDCVVAGSPQNGIIFGDGTDVKLRGCLIAGNWNTGLSFGELNAKLVRTHVIDCDIRNNRYAGISLGTTGDSRIEGCRISGAAWHGIRCGDPMAVIEGNAIFRNARSGIYGGGQTTASIRNNLFYRNDINGISCWNGNRDVIEQNTFVGSRFGGVICVDDAQPILRKNIFFENVVAIRGSWSFRRTNGVAGEPRLEENLFWNNRTNFFRVQQVEGSTNFVFDLELPTNSRSLLASPGFADAAKADFSLPAESAAARADIGAAMPLSMRSSFPLLPEEIAIIPNGDTRDWNQWKTPPQPDLKWVNQRITELGHRLQSKMKRPRGVSYPDAFKDLYDTLGREYAGFNFKGIDWKSVGAELLPRAARVKTDEEFGLLCHELVARLEDSHAYLGKGLLSPPAIEFPRYDPGMACLLDEHEKLVVYHVDRIGPAAKAGVKAGMTVLSINSKSAEQVMRETMQSLRKSIGYSSERYLRYQMARWAVRQMKSGTIVDLELEDVGGKKYSLKLPADLDVRYLPRLPVPIPGIPDSASVAWKMLDDDIGYLYVRRIRPDLIAQLDKAIAELRSAKGLIIDVRGNSGGGFDFVRSHINFMADESREPERPRFKGPMAVLIDSRCISAGEGWASWFVANKRAKLFGETTAGASSRKKTYELKNKLYTVTYSVKPYKGYLNRIIERRGLEPDFEIKPTAKDLSSGRDTVLEAARGFLLREKK